MMIQLFRRDVDDTRRLLSRISVVGLLKSFVPGSRNRTLGADTGVWGVFVAVDYLINLLVKA